MRLLPIQIAAPLRHDRKTSLHLERGDAELSDDLVMTLGLERHRFNPDLSITAAIQMRPELHCGDFESVDTLSQELTGGAVNAAYLAARATDFARRIDDLFV